MEKHCVENVKIKDITLGLEDHGILTIWISCEGDGWGVSYGGYCLNEYNRESNKTVGTAYGCDCILRLLETFEVYSFDKIKGLNARLEFDNEDKYKGRAIRIGNIVKDKWFSFEELANEFKEKDKKEEENKLAKEQKDDKNEKTNNS